MPSRGTPAGRWPDRRQVDATSSESPGHDRVGVPHLTDVRLVATPHRRRYLRQHFEHTSRAHDRCGHTHGTSDRSTDVRNSAVAPSPDFVAEDAEPTRASDAHRPFGNDASGGAVRIRYRCLFHDESALGHLHDQCRVVEIASCSVTCPGGQRFEDLPADPYDMGAGSERYPIQIDRGSGVAPSIHTGCCCALARMVRTVARKMWATNGRMTVQ